VLEGLGYKVEGANRATGQQVHVQQQHDGGGASERLVAARHRV
jgi:hypothetical protein